LILDTSTKKPTGGQPTDQTTGSEVTSNG
jgi:hypothetical protein